MRWRAARTSARSGTGQAVMPRVYHGARLQAMTATAAFPRRPLAAALLGLDRTQEWHPRENPFKGGCCGHRIAVWFLALHCANLSIMGVSHDPAQAAKPCVFVGSSSESLKYAEATKRILEETGTLSVIYWKDLPVTAGSRVIIDMLTEAAEQQFDFAVFILSQDDVLTFRGESTSAPRDNVVFEVGLFIGALGRGKVFLIAPDKGKLKEPSDLGGR